MERRIGDAWWEIVGDSEWWNVWLFIGGRLECESRV